MTTQPQPQPLEPLKMSEKTANHFATHAALRDWRRFSYWPSRTRDRPIYQSSNPAAFTGLSTRVTNSGGHST